MKCGTTVCFAIATTKCWWPGKTTDVCTPCADRLREIAAVMGFELPVAPLTTSAVIAEANRQEE